MPNSHGDSSVPGHFLSYVDAVQPNIGDNRLWLDLEDLQLELQPPSLARTTNGLLHTFGFALALVWLCLGAACPPPIAIDSLDSQRVAYATAWDSDGPGPAASALVVLRGTAAPESATMRVSRLDGDKWVDLGGDVSSLGVDGPLLAYRNELYVGGNPFAVPVRPATLAGVLRWNGSEWVPIPDSAANIADMVVWNDLLVVAGNQEMGRTGSSVAAWDGAAWRSLELGRRVFNPWHLDVIGSELVITAQTDIIRWDGATSSSITSGLPASWTSGDIVEVDGSIYIVFDRVATFGLPDVARWDGNAWQSLPGAPEDVTFAVRFRSNLIVAKLGGNVLYSWNGENWNETIVEPAFSSERGVWEMVVFQDRLYATVSTTPLTLNVFVWDGETWGELPR